MGARRGRLLLAIHSFLMLLVGGSQQCSLTKVGIIADLLAEDRRHGASWAILSSVRSLHSFIRSVPPCCVGLAQHWAQGLA